MAKSKSGDFYSFDEVLRQLSIDENRLKRLVSEGEIRAFREGDQMRFKRSEIDALAGRSGRGSSSSDTSLTEISLEDESQPTVNVGAGAPDTLADDLLDEGGMRTAEISSQETYIEGDRDVGMSTEPIDFTEEPEGIDEEVEDIAVDRGRRRAPAASPARRRVSLEEPRTNPVLVLVLAVTVLLGAWAVAVTISLSRGHSNSLTRWPAETFRSGQDR